jgi:hypothetical protein
MDADWAGLVVSRLQRLRDQLLVRPMRSSRRTIQQPRQGALQEAVLSPHEALVARQ